jgi:hypothetical protein
MNIKGERIVIDPEAEIALNKRHSSISARANNLIRPKDYSWLEPVPVNGIQKTVLRCLQGPESNWLSLYAN